jgi:MFS family permease
MTTATTTVPTGADSTERRRWLMLAVLITGQFMALLDVTIVNVAIPTIREKLDASGAALQLIVAGYTVTYAMLLITGARLGDLRGPRRLFLAGLGTFTLASLACGLAPTTGALITARSVQGAGAALMVPQILSVIQRQFAGGARARALGVYAATLASGAVVGQVLGGLRLDLTGLVTASGAVLLVVLPLVLGHEQGWPAWTFLSLAAGMLLVGVFVRVERSVAARGGDPLLDLGVLGAPGLVAGLAALTAAMIGYGGFLFTLALHLQLGLGDSALHAGLTFAPGALAFGATGYWWRRLPGRVHHALTPAGFAVAALAYLGLAVTLQAGTRGGPWLLVLLVLYGIGFGAAFSPLVTQALVQVPPAKAADASGLLTTTIQLSQVLGVAVFGSLFLGLASQPGAHASAAAFSTVERWLAALTLLGVVGALLLARTVRDAMRTVSG